MSEPPLAFLQDEEPHWQARLSKHFTGAERAEWDFDFRYGAHAGQLPPDGNWRIWLIMAGRGFGKTRAGAEWVRSVAEADPAARIALVAASLAEARSVMVEGESGIMAICPPNRFPKFEPSLRRLRFPNGAEATLYSAAEPESLRGPQHSHACGAGSEGVHHQRSTRSARWTFARSCRRRSQCSARRSRHRGKLDCGATTHR